MKKLIEMLEDSVSLLEELVGFGRPDPKYSKKSSVSGKKYELTDEKIKFKGRTLYRIKALKSFGDIKAGLINILAYFFLTGRKILKRW